MSDLEDRVCFRCGHPVARHGGLACHIDGCMCALSKAEVIAAFLTQAESLLADMVEEKQRLRKALQEIVDGAGTALEAAIIADKALKGERFP